MPRRSYRERERCIIIIKTRQVAEGQPGWGEPGIQTFPSQAAHHPRRPALPPPSLLFSPRLSRPRRQPATSSGCSCGSPPPTRAAPTRARTPAPALGLESSGSSAAGNTKRRAELWRRRLLQPGPTPHRRPHHLGRALRRTRDRKDRTHPGPRTSRSRAPGRAAPTCDLLSRDTTRDRVTRDRT